jgi:hypothetical protein
MRSTARHRFRCARRVREFFRLYPESDRATVAALVCLDHVLSQVEILIRDQMQAQFDAGSALKSLRDMAGPFKDRLAQLVRLARVVALRVGVPALNFSIGFGKSREGRFPSAAGAAIATAIEHRTVLLDHGMPADMLEELSEDLGYYVEAMDRRARALAASKAATAEFTQLAYTAMVIMRHLDALSCIRYELHPERLREWNAALSGTWGEKMVG